jgi:uncharacterized Zn finger protein (UPF0148 family)
MALPPKINNKDCPKCKTPMREWDGTLQCWECGLPYDDTPDMDEETLILAERKLKIKKYIEREKQYAKKMKKEGWVMDRREQVDKWLQRWTFYNLIQTFWFVPFILFIWTIILPILIFIFFKIMSKKAIEHTELILEWGDDIHVRRMLKISNTGLREDRRPR